METHDNMILENKSSNSDLDVTFKENGWHVIDNDLKSVCYGKYGQETDVFCIKFKQKNVFVSFPIKDSNYQFTTSFTDYNQASKYIETRFNDFINNKKVIF